MSSTATTFPSLTIGTTISDRESELQAICPGNRSTSGTITVSPVLTAAQQNSRMMPQLLTGNGSLVRADNQFVVDKGIHPCPEKVCIL